MSYLSFKIAFDQHFFIQNLFHIEVYVNPILAEGLATDKQEQAFLTLNLHFFYFIVSVFSGFESTSKTT